MTYVRTPPHVWVYQPQATLIQASPSSGTEYTVVDTTINCRVITAMAYVAWTVQPTTLELHIDIDGERMTFPVSNPISGTVYYAVIESKDLDSALILSTTDYFAYKNFLIEGRSVKVTAEVTGGTSTSLGSYVRTAVKE